MYLLATKHIENNEPTCRWVWTPPACDVNKVTFMKLASERQRREAATASSRRFLAAAMLFVARSTIGLY